jgi:FixJ family two-component response regulator
VSKPVPLIAVVDDEESVCRALDRLIRSAGMNVMTFTGAFDFLQFLKTRRPDCLILDLHMPGMSGFELQSRVARGENSVPIVVVTGHDVPQSRQRVLDAGAVAYLRKPVDDEALLDAVAAAMARPNQGDGSD